MNKTPNYQLSQWEASDEVLRTDFNADNAKIDAAIADAKPKFAVGTYTGDGVHAYDHFISLTFDFEPQLVIVQSQDGNFNGVQMILFRGVTKAQVIGCYKSSSSPASTYQTATVVWESNTVSWRVWGPTPDETASVFEANSKNQPYNYFAIG